MGVAAADYDNDGRTDLFVTGVRGNHLYRNLGNGKFVDVTGAAGVSGDGTWSVAAGWFDYDADGLLDLFVVRYVAWDPAAERVCGRGGSGYRSYCHPRYYRPLPNALYRNLGKGAFRDVSVGSGIAAHRGKGMGLAIGDVNGDGRLDVFVSNDTAPNFLFHNDGSGRFTEKAGGGKVIVEGFIDFEYEITLLTVRHRDVTSLCEPIGHLQIDGDYRESWQPQPMRPKALERAQAIAAKVTGELGGHGIFGVELFVKGDEVWFSEVSPRPHDTGLVTLISQDLSELALHARAILGLPIPAIRQLGPAASAVILPEGDSNAVAYANVDGALVEPDTMLRLFGKPEVRGHRRMGVALARDADVDVARAKARRAAAAVRVLL